MKEPGLILFECDSGTDCGVRLMVTAESLEGMAVMRFQIDVDGAVLAAYVGPQDVESLIAFLQRNKR